MSILCHAMASITFLIMGYTHCIILTSLLFNNNRLPPPPITLKVEIAFVFLATLYLEMALISIQKMFMEEGRRERKKRGRVPVSLSTLAISCKVGDVWEDQGPLRGREQKSLSVAFVEPLPCLLNCSYSCQQPPEEGKERGGERD